MDGKIVSAIENGLVLTRAHYKAVLFMVAKGSVLSSFWCIRRWFLVALVAEVGLNWLACVKRCTKTHSYFC